MTEKKLELYNVPLNYHSFNDTYNISMHPSSFLSAQIYRLRYINKKNIDLIKNITYTLNHTSFLSAASKYFQVK